MCIKVFFFIDIQSLNKYIKKQCSSVGTVSNHILLQVGYKERELQTILKKMALEV